MKRNYCLYCSLAIDQYSKSSLCISGVWFCSTAHHIAYKIDHKGILPELKGKRRKATFRKKRQPIPCITCGIIFTPKKDSQLNCSADCADEYYAFEHHGETFAMSFCPWKDIGVSQPGVPLEEQRQPDAILGF